MEGLDADWFRDLGAFNGLLSGWMVGQVIESFVHAKLTRSALGNVGGLVSFVQKRNWTNQ